MADIVAFPTDAVTEFNDAFRDPSAQDRFLLDEGLELLADFRSIPDDGVRASIRLLIKSIACQADQAPR